MVLCPQLTPPTSRVGGLVLEGLPVPTLLPVGGPRYLIVTPIVASSPTVATAAVCCSLLPLELVRVVVHCR